MTYQRIVRDFPQYNPRLLSQPGHAIAKARSTASPSPWVVTLDNFLDDDEVEADPNPNPDPNLSPNPNHPNPNPNQVEAFITGCHEHFDRSLAGDQLSPVRTSSQCWCSDSDC